MNITKVEAKENYQLLVHAEEGLVGLFDVSPYLESEAFEDLKKRGTIFLRFVMADILLHGNAVPICRRIRLKRSGELFNKFSSIVNITIQARQT